MIWLAVIAGILFAIPNLFSPATLQSFPGFLPKSQLALGLDLQGGVHLQLKLDRKELVENGSNRCATKSAACYGRRA